MVKQLNEKQRKHKAEFSSGLVGQKFRQEVYTTEFERLLKRLGLSEDTAHLNEEVRQWCRTHKDSKYIPEPFLLRVHVRTRYDETLAPFTLTESGIVIPEPAPLVEIELEEEGPEQAA